MLFKKSRGKGEKGEDMVTKEEKDLEVKIREVEKGLDEKADEESLPPHEDSEDEEIDEELLPPPEDLEDEEIDEELLPPPEDSEEKGEEGGEEEEEIEKELEEEEDIEEEGEGKERSPWRSAAWDLMKDVLIAFLIVIIIIGSIYLYTGNWPPVVVVESNSMQHSNDESFFSVIDTGDLVLVKKTDGRNDVVTYMEGKRIGHETYSENGDVLIFRKNGYTDTTPVIHRAIIWVEYNETSNSFDIPELKHHNPGVGEDGVWYVVGGEQRWYNLSGTIVLKDIGHDHLPVSINLGTILSIYGSQGVEPHSGFITLGDNNRGSYDQGNMDDGHGHRVRPVKPEWIVGKGRGELPWFGLIKLYFQDPAIREDAPSNSWTMLFVTLVLIIAVPICIDIFLILYERRKAKMEEKKEEEEEEFGGGEGEEGESEEELEGEELEAEEEEEPPPPEDWEEEEPPPPDDEL
jgi:signal peptidase